MTANRSDAASIHIHTNKGRERSRRQHQQQYNNNTTTIQQQQQQQQEKKTKSNMFQKIETTILVFKAREPYKGDSSS
jgi:hypothetical protein